MVYILDQRLRAQNIPDEKAKKGEVPLLSNFCEKWVGYGFVYCFLHILCSSDQKKYCSFAISVERFSVFIIGMLIRLSTINTGFAVASFLIN